MSNSNIVVQILQVDFDCKDLDWSLTIWLLFCTDLNSSLHILNSCLFQTEAWPGSAAPKSLLGNLHMFADVICLVNVINIIIYIIIVLYITYLATVLLCSIIPYLAILYPTWQLSFSIVLYPTYLATNLLHDIIPYLATILLYSFIPYLPGNYPSP